MSLSEATQEKEKPAHWWKPGVSANPAGRPKGSRNKLGELFVEALHDDFKAHGVATIVKVREDRPADYLKVVASLLPKEFHVRDSTFDDMTDEQLFDLIGAIRSAHLAAPRSKIIEGSVAPESKERADSVHGVDVPKV